MSANNRKSLLRHLFLVITLLLVTMSVEPVDHVLAASSWYVATTGDDSNSCSAPGLPCATINGVLGKVSNGDTIYVAEGTYTGSAGREVVRVERNVNLLGGWNAAFTTRIGISKIDGQDTQRGITIFSDSVTL